MGTLGHTDARTSSGSRLRVRRRGARLLIGILATTSLVVTSTPAATGEPTSVPTDAGAAPPVVSPEQGVPESLDGLQYGDPTAGVDLVDPPATDSYGSASTAHPIDLPTGREEWQPDLQLAYSSGAGNGWLGVGWDLAVDSIPSPDGESSVPADAIEVDTRWGVPRYDEDAESETYLFGGEQLAPGAHRSPLQDREGERVFTQRVEGGFLRIIRHGAAPLDYWWEVHDKAGNKYFYGGRPDDVGDGDYTGAGTQDPDAVLKTDKGVYWWGLTEKWDISSNVVTYFYERVEDAGVTNQAGAPQGENLYLSRINYTGSRLRKEAAGDFPLLPRYGVYDVWFERDRDLGEPRRPDAFIDARHGALEVTADLLRQVWVTYTPASGGSEQLVRRYDLKYRTGPFDKQLLASVTKIDANGDRVSQNRFDYFDDAHDDGGSFDPFGSPQKWNTAGEPGNDDGLSEDFLGTPSGSALGATKSLGGDGRLFLGVSYLEPSKLIGVGGGVQLGGADGESNVELIDINGDNLPDKVWERSGCGGGYEVCYRLNTARPGTDTNDLRFGPVRGVVGLSHLGENNEFSVGAGAEVYLGANAMYNHTWSFSKQTSYFSDVNADGLPDLVRDGDVLFNHYDKNSGEIRFSESSSGTQVPISQDNSIPLGMVPDQSQVAEEQAELLPRQDTLRRWVAPSSGHIEITAPVRLVDPDKSVDGVRVAIQHNGDELWSSRIPGGDGSEHVPTGVNDIDVDAGEQIFFRVGSMDNGAGDRVHWDPVIQYKGHTPGQELDVNGKDLWYYQASEDFTLAGLDGSLMTAPYDGRIRVVGDIVKTKPTSDDVHVQLLKNDEVVEEMCLRGSAEGPSQADCVPPPGTTDTGTFPFEAEVDVTGRHEDADGNSVPGDKLSLRLSVHSNIDPNAVTWKPELQYVSGTYEDGTPLETTDPDGNPLIKISVPYDFDLYPNTDISLPQTTGNEDDVLLQFAVNRDDLPDISLPARVTFTAKTDDGVLRFKHTFTIPAGDGTYRYPEGPCSPECPADDFHWEGYGGSHQTYYDFTFDDGAVARATTVLLDRGGLPAAKWWPGTRVIDDTADVFPPPYRGWGYASYRSDGPRAEQPVNEEDLVIRRDDLPDPDDRPTSEDDPNFKNPIKGTSYPFAPYPANGLWIGAKFDDSDPTADPTEQRPCPWPFDGCLAPRGIWGGPDQASASLLGGDTVGAPPPDEIITGPAEAPVIYGKSEAHSLGVNFGPLGGGVSTGVNEGLVDFLDMNGDVFPDVLGDDEVLFTNQTGGFAERFNILDGPVRTNHSYGTQAGAGGSPAAIGGDAKGDGVGTGKGKSAGAENAEAPGGSKSKKVKAAKIMSKLTSLLGVGGSLSHEESNTDNGLQFDCAVDGCTIQEDLADLNGDGLPDRVEVEKDDGGATIFVRWNLGYGFTQSSVEFAHAPLDQGSSDGRALNASIGFGTGLLDFSGGVSLSEEDERTERAWIDVNGDGLADLLEADVTPVTGVSDHVVVHLNSGTGLLPSVELDDEFIDDHFARTKCTGVGGGADFTIGIPIPIELVFILINPGFGVSKGNCTPTHSLEDVDGDGAVDSVNSTEDGTMHVALNRTGRTNLLKTVRGPLGGRVDLDYARAGNTPEHPSSVYALSKVVVDDGHAGDGADQQVTTYRFENGRESIAEREDYGFGTVVEEQRDPATGDVYRYWKRDYRNDSYYSRGLLRSEVLHAANGTPVTGTENGYRFTKVGTDNPADLTSLLDSVYPELSSTERTWYDGGDPAKSTLTEYEHDRRGNLTKVTDHGEPSTTDDDVVAETTYPDCHTNDEFPWTQSPADSLVVRSGTTVLQRREADVPCDYAAAVQVRDYLEPTGDDPSKIAVTDVCFAPVGGQVSAVIGPSKTGEVHDEACGDDGMPDDPGPGRYTVIYKYEDPDRLGAEPTSTTDSYDMLSTSVYDNRFGHLVSTTDPVGATTSYEYDAANRLVRVVGPLEQGTGRTTISYEYHPEEAAVPYSIARHIDAANPGTTIDTVTFVDGLGRTIEQKRDATVFDPQAGTARDRMVVAAQTHFDAFGRTVKEFYEGVEPVGTPDVFNDQYDDQHVTVIDYDVRDREVKRVEPGTRTTTTAYGFDSGPFGTPRFTKLVTGPEGARQRTWTDVRENVVGQERLHATPDGDQSLLTRYTHDPLQRLTSATDPTGATTTSTYDLLGRRTSVDSPDKGLTTFTYDLASNITTKQTAVLRRTGQRIRYLYDDFITLEHILYPRNPQNNVTYEYGSYGDPDYAAGKLTKVEDGARATSFTYDPLGRAVAETHLMKAPDLSPLTMAKHTFTFTRTYDTWGRQLTMTYPDGETVTTGYDSGGLPRALTGTKNGTTQTVVSRAEYDRFGHPQYMEYGNGMTSQRTYDPNTQWLARQLLKKGTATWSDLRYVYDKAGNVTERNDVRPAPTSTELSGPSAQSFTYDDLNRLTEASGSYTDAFRRTRTYTLDLEYGANGLLLRKNQVDKLGTQVRGATTFDQPYQYNSGHPHAPSRVGDRTYTWDPDGNMAGWQETLSGAIREVLWDEEDRIKLDTDDTGHMTYQYDDEGRLRITTGSNPNLTKELVSDEYAVVGDQAWKTYFLGDQPVATTRVFAAQDVLLFYMVSDLTDSPFLLADRSKLIENSLVLPSGQPWVQELTTFRRARYPFAGGYFDEATDNYHMGVRWYDPRDGLFLSVDPLLVEDLDAVGEDPGLLSAYGYASDNPTTYVDKTGTESVSAQLSQKVQPLVARFKKSTLYLKASEAYNDSGLKARRDAYTAKVKSDEFKDRASKVSSVLNEISNPTVFKLQFVFNEDGSFAGPRLKIFGKTATHFNKIRRFFKK